MKIAFIGLGIMGSRMAANLLKAGYKVKVYNRTFSKTDELVKKGGERAESPADASLEADVLFTMLSTPDVVRDTAYGENGFLSFMKKNSIWADCSTVNPSFSREMAEAANKKGVRFIDAPVAGSKQPAENGELLIFAGGDKKDIEEITPLLNLIGKKIFYAGENGMGSSFKIVSNLILAGAMEAFSEAMVLGEYLGIPQEKLFENLLGGAVTAPFIALKKDKIGNLNFEPDFLLRWLIKDIRLAIKSAGEKNLKLPAADFLEKIYSLADKAGLGEMDFSAIYKFIKDQKMN